MHQKDFKVLTFKELLECLEKENLTVNSFTFQLNKTSNAYVYFLKDNSVLLLPNNCFEKNLGMYFLNKSTFENYLRIDSFPIKEKYPCIEQEHLSVVKNINKEIDKIITSMHKKFCSNNKLLNSKEDDYLENLIANLKFQWKKMSRHDKYFCSLILSEYIRRKINGRWMLLKQYGSFNPYYQAAISDKDDNFSLLTLESKRFFESNNIDLELFCKLINVDNLVYNKSNTYAADYINLEN